MTAKTVRQEFITQFRGLRSYPRAQASVIVAFYLVQVLGAIVLGAWLIDQGITLLSGLGLAGLMFFIGTRLRGFNNIVHECTHFAFAERREDNVLIGSFCASMVLSCFKDYRDEHMTHHAHLGDYEKDLDLQGIRDFRLEAPLTPRTVLRHILTPLLGLHLPYYLNINLSARDGMAFKLLKVALIAAAVIYLVVDPLTALLMVWVPFVWVYSTINYWTDCIDHGGLVEAGDELYSSRNVRLPFGLKYLLFPRNDCYHLIHHLFPQIPARHFAICHDRLMENHLYRDRVEEGLPATVIDATAMTQPVHVEKH